MDIHKPKAAHSWREFLIEIGTIVCGILIAIGLEQVVESVHWAEKVREARASIHHDLTQVTVFADERIAEEGCKGAYLDALADSIIASPPQWRPRSNYYCGLPHRRVFDAGFRPWPLEVWRAVEAEGVVSHFDEHYRSGAAFLFGFIATTAALATEEQMLSSELDPLAKPVTLTPDAKMRLLTTIARLKRYADNITLSSRQFKGLMKSIGETPTPAELDELRAQTPGVFLSPGVVLNFGKLRPPPKR